jgi:uncharacterized protein YjbI with pentapeptide repeats
MKMITRLFGGLFLLILLSVTFRGTCAAQNKDWTWRDKTGVTHTAADLKEILRQHSDWLHSDEEKGKRADLAGANLQGADFKSADLSKALLSSADLTDATLASAQMVGADLRNAVLSPPQPKVHYGFAAPVTNLAAGHLIPDFPCEIDRFAPPGRANLAGANLSFADFSGAHLEGVNLDSASLRGAKLRGAFLQVANLSRANLDGANLDAASLDGALLTHAKLSGTSLTDTNFANVELCETVFEPKTLPTAVRELASTVGLDWVTYDHNPDALVQLRKQFRDGGFEAQERKVTYAIRKREADMLRANCTSGALGDCAEYLFNRIFLDFTCQYGMRPGRPLVLFFWIWIFCSVTYYDFIATPGSSKLYRISFETLELKADPSAHQKVVAIGPDHIAGGTRLSKARKKLLQHLSLLGVAMFFSLMSAFNISFREINFGRWLRLLTRKEFDIKAVGWARVIAGWQALISLLLIALFVLTFFGRPFG